MRALGARDLGSIPGTPIYMNLKFNKVFFDCDSTLISVESLDLLGGLCGVGEEVRLLTEQSMNGVVPIEVVFKKKIDIISPSVEDVVRLTSLISSKICDGAVELIKKLKEKGVGVYMVTSNFKTIVYPLADKFGISCENVFANDLYFNNDGGYAGINEKSPLIKTGGKAFVVKKNLNVGDRSVFIGDGSTDLCTKSVVDLFIGFGGVVTREIVKKDAAVFISDNNLLSIEPYIL